MTVLEVVTAAAGYLEKHGVESPRLNAEHLLAHVLKKRRLDLYLEFDRPLSDVERAPLRELIRERGVGRPLQHLLGTTEFFGRTFRCDARALVPRPETEQLVEFLVARARGLSPTRILDVGTGTGVIAITLAHQFPNAEVIATDISPEALALATENAAAHSFDSRLKFLPADLFAPGESGFDIIAANLPYIASGEIPALQREVQFDPMAALDGGPDGLAIVERLISAGPSHLAKSGLVALELGHDQAERVAARLAEIGFRDIEIKKDYQDVPRFVLAAAPE